MTLRPPGDGHRFLCLLLLALLVPMLSLAQVADPAPLRFQDAHEEQRFHALVTELRCVMCQNQSLADSNAQIAHDLRREVLGLMREHRSDADIKRFLVARYGEFVLLKPRLNPRTALLWLLPPLALMGGGIALWIYSRRRERAADAERQTLMKLSPDEEARLEKLLGAEQPAHSDEASS